MGGIILIGIQAGKKTNTPENIKGIELVDGLTERVINICLSRISPTVIPEVKVLPFNSNRAVLFIRVRGPDYSSPHYLVDSNEILIRANNRNERADLKTIEDLLEIREEFESEAYQTSAFHGNKEIGIECEAFESVIFQPHFPIEGLVFYYKEDNNWLFSTVENVFTVARQKVDSYQLVLEGVNAMTKDVTRWCGIYKDGRIVLQRSSQVKKDMINLPATLDLLFMAIKIARQIYARYGYYGRITIGLVIIIDKSKKLRVGPQDMFPESEQFKESTIAISDVFSYDDLSEPQRIMQFFLPEILLKAGLVCSRDDLEKIITRIVS